MKLLLDQGLPRSTVSELEKIDIDSDSGFKYPFYMKEIEINAFYDEDARMWVAENDEIGLATEAESVEVLTYKLKEMIPELVELNNIEVPHPVEFSLITRRKTLAFT